MRKTYILKVQRTYEDDVTNHDEIEYTVGSVKAICRVLVLQPTTNGWGYRLCMSKEAIEHFDGWISSDNVGYIPVPGHDSIRILDVTD